MRTVSSTGWIHGSPDSPAVAPFLITFSDRFSAALGRGPLARARIRRAPYAKEKT